MFPTASGKFSSSQWALTGVLHSELGSDILPGGDRPYRLLELGAQIAHFRCHSDTCASDRLAIT